MWFLHKISCQLFGIPTTISLASRQRHTPHLSLVPFLPVLDAHHHSPRLHVMVDVHVVGYLEVKAPCTRSVSLPASDPVPQWPSPTQRSCHRHHPLGDPPPVRHVLLHVRLANRELYTGRDRDGRPPELRRPVCRRREVSPGRSSRRCRLESWDEEAR